MSVLEQRQTDELRLLKDENSRLALTICELEESLDRATTKVKEYKAEITSMERTLAGQLTELALNCVIRATVYISETSFTDACRT